MTQKEQYEEILNKLDKFTYKEQNKTVVFAITGILILLVFFR